MNVYGYTSWGSFEGVQMWKHPDGHYIGVPADKTLLDVLITLRNDSELDRGY